MEYMEEYKEQMKDDIREFMEEIDTTFEDRCDVEDLLWNEDRITGNASGSYFCNAYKAKMMIDSCDDAEDCIRELIEELCLEPKTIAAHLFDWEYWDVSIRCFLLNQVLYDMTDEELHIKA